MKLFRTSDGWVAHDGTTAAKLNGFDLGQWLGQSDPVSQLSSLFKNARPAASPEPTRLLPPIANQEVWAAGVTYLRSKAARMEESDFAATAYDRVYEAPRPELFFKATPARCAGTGQTLTLRDDSKWMVPEPELTLVVAANQKIVGYTIGNDMSCRDIEGDNTLYLPQAKIWNKCCGLGPCIRIADESISIRDQSIALSITREGKEVFSGSTQISRIRRTFDDLVGYLFRNQPFEQGVFMLTGTGIVPPDEFTLQRGDTVHIDITGIGRLSNAIE